MEKNGYKTVVIFRKFTDGDILALFPQEMNYPNYTGRCESYMHVGQHSAADYSACIEVTKPATSKEYKSLKRELEGLGYNLKVRKKYVR